MSNPDPQSIEHLALKGAIAPALAHLGIRPDGLALVLDYAASRARWEGGQLVALDRAGNPLFGRHGIFEGVDRLASDLRAEYPDLFSDHWKARP